MKKIVVSDITLKSISEQGISLTFRERLAIAEKLNQTKVDAFELPALINNKENEVIYSTIARTAKNTIVKIPVGDTLQSLQDAIKCVSSASKVCLQVVMPISTAMMEYNYHLKAQAMLAKIEELIIEAKKHCELVELVALDAFRAEDGFAVNCAKTAYNAGAYAITICDDAGVAMPSDYSLLVGNIKGSCDIDIFVQPNNALSMAAASVVESIKAGADGIKTSCVGDYFDLNTFAEFYRAKRFDFDIESSIDVTNVNHLQLEISNIVTKKEIEEQSSFEVKKAIDKDTTIMDISLLVSQIGYELTDDDIGKVYEEVKKLVAKKEAIEIKELEAVVASTAMQVPSTYHLINFVVNSGNIIPATANITLEKNGEKFTGVSTGDGPIDAAFHAIEQVIGHHYELDDFQVQAVTKGRGAVGSSIIRLRSGGKLYSGNGVSTDIIGACIRAYINALNKIVYEEK